MISLCRKSTCSFSGFPSCRMLPGDQTHLKGDTGEYFGASVSCLSVGAIAPVREISVVVAAADIL
ncbi:hypothetical protein A7K99_19495 [Tatumella citrea]|uniref:Uncharacterized protein n=1 Tax=Tatumella citrea TaxID=53336 RepID=A0A1Y0LDG6_TATCI|nr:hypothetical protein A7K98_19510 [Tatumella citrea]ARU99750.1 hypothetical protein A7K99_19495 [Tatumella citrea]